MNIQQWKARIQDARTRAELVRIQDSYSEELKARGELLRGLKQHGGWKVLEEYFDQEEVLLRNLLEVAKIEDVQAIQCELKVLKKFRSFLRNSVSIIEN